MTKRVKTRKVRDRITKCDKCSIIIVLHFELFRFVETVAIKNQTRKGFVRMFYSDKVYGTFVLALLYLSIQDHKSWA
jgi:hypothetical protein